MNSSSQTQGITKRQCAYCGRFSPSHFTRCPDCREMLPEIAVAHRPQAKKGNKIRQGLLYMLLAAVIQYFAGGYSAMNLPFQINPLVSPYLAPLLFISGLGLAVYGFCADR
jgi:hypothetical protein